MNKKTWSENIILADADYVDKVAFDLTVNFERMLGRRIPQADLARWVECIALDGGLRAGDHQTHVILVHDHQSMAMQNFVPGLYRELAGKAFKSPLGEFTLTATSGEGLAPKDQLFIDTLQFVASQGDVERLMVVSTEALYNKVGQTLRTIDRPSAQPLQATLFAMQPMPGGPFLQEILGYSLMSALGIKSDEINNQL